MRLTYRTLDMRKYSNISSLFACLLLGAVYSLLRGQDAAWDLKNYHLYNAWAFLHGRLAIDLAPAGLQGFFNPILDVPYYFLGTVPLEHSPRLLAAFQGLWFGGLIFIILKFLIRFAELQKRHFGMIDIFAMLIGITGSMAVSQAGTSLNEVPLALFVLLSFYQLLPLCSEGHVSNAFRRVLLAGLVGGFAAGLKPTAIIYPPALALGLFIALGCRARACRLTTGYVLGAFVGFLIAYGWWAWKLYALTGNPIFPMFNQVFHSTWVPASAGVDRQFAPRNLTQWLFYPFYWVTKNSRVVTEIPFADARYALSMLSMACLAIHGFLIHQKNQPKDMAVRLLLVFVTAAYALWLVLFSILRYAVSLEVLSGLLIMLALQQLFACARTDAFGKHWSLWSMIVIFVAVAASTHYPNWGHAPYAKSAFDVKPGAIEAGSLVVVLGQPQAYVIPFLSGANSSEFVGLTWLDQLSKGYRLWGLTRERIKQYQGPMYALLRDDAGDDLALLLQILPQARLTDCHAVASNLEYSRSGRSLSMGLRLCKVFRS